MQLNIYRYSCHKDAMNDDARKTKDSLTKPIVLTGLMGAGKTKIGGVLARILDVPFVDADHEIEAAAGQSIPDIFAQYGEPEFRDLERRVIARLLDGGVQVVSTGGGAVMNEQTRAAIHEKSISIWLDASLDTLVARTAGYNDRPLLRNGDAREILSGLLEKRRDAYAQAHITIDSSRDNAEETAAIILAALETHLT